jgi:hypothetical protein
MVDHRTEGLHECRTVRYRRPPGCPPTGGYPDHDCSAAGCTVIECPPHHRRPLSAATIRRIHVVISATLGAAMRWDWITTNPPRLRKSRDSQHPSPIHPQSSKRSHRRRGLVAGRELGNPRVARHGYRTPASRAAGAALVRCRPRYRHAQYPEQLRAGHRGERSRRTPKPTKCAGSPWTRRLSRCSPNTGSATRLSLDRCRWSPQIRNSCSRTHRRTTGPLTQVLLPIATATCAPNVASIAHLHALRHYSATEFHRWCGSPHRRWPAWSWCRRRHDASCLRRMGRRIRPPRS